MKYFRTGSQLLSAVHMIFGTKPKELKHASGLLTVGLLGQGALGAVARTGKCQAFDL